MNDLELELLSALKGIMRQIEIGSLVRETASDDAPGWGMRQVPLVMALKAADGAIHKAEQRIEEDVMRIEEDILERLKRL